MVVSIVTVDELQNIPLLKPLVAGLVTGFRGLLRVVVCPRYVVVVCSYSCILAAVTSVGFDHLARQQHMNQITTEDLDIWPPTTRKRPVYPYNITGLNAYSNFVSEARALELVTVPLLALGPWGWRVYRNVGTVDSDLTSPPFVGSETIVPYDLKRFHKHQMK